MIVDGGSLIPPSLFWGDLDVEKNSQLCMWEQEEGKAHAAATN